MARDYKETTAALREIGTERALEVADVVELFAEHCAERAAALSTTSPHTAKVDAECAEVCERAARAIRMMIMLDVEE